MRPLLRALLLTVTVAAPLMAQATGIPDADRTRLAEAFRIARSVGDSAWRGWDLAPFAVLLLTPRAEFLLNHPRPTSDFTRVGYDSVLGSEVYMRAPTLPPTLLATFPAVGGVNTIVVGGAAQVGRRSTHWVLTVLHEHFHQLQMADPGYQERLQAIDLARGDMTGQWMLTFPFPYGKAAVQAKFTAFANALRDAAFAPAPVVPDALLRQVASTRTTLKAALAPAEYRYLSFQMWQEGVARYMELRVARLAAGAGPQLDGMRALPDVTSYADEADALEREMRTATTVLPMASVQRVAFYATGAAYALLLDRVRPAWPSQYFTVPLSLDPLLPLIPAPARAVRRR